LTTQDAITHLRSHGYKVCRVGLRKHRLDSGRVCSSLQLVKLAKGLEGKDIVSDTREN
jgi:hypothetical protein